MLCMKVQEIWQEYFVNSVKLCENGLPSVHDTATNSHYSWLRSQLWEKRNTEHVHDTVLILRSKVFVSQSQISENPKFKMSDR